MGRRDAGMRKLMWHRDAERRKPMWHKDAGGRKPVGHRDAERRKPRGTGMQEGGSSVAQGCRKEEARGAQRSPGGEQLVSPGARAGHRVLGQLLGRAMTATVAMPTWCLWGRNRALRAFQGQKAAGSLELELAAVRGCSAAFAASLGSCCSSTRCRRDSRLSC